MKRLKTFLQERQTLVKLSPELKARILPEVEKLPDNQPALFRGVGEKQEAILQSSWRKEEGWFGLNLLHKEDQEAVLNQVQKHQGTTKPVFVTQKYWHQQGFGEGGKKVLRGNQYVFVPIGSYKLIHNTTSEDIVSVIRRGKTIGKRRIMPGPSLTNQVLDSFQEIRITQEVWGEVFQNVTKYWLIHVDQLPKDLNKKQTNDSLTYGDLKKFLRGDA